MAWVSWCPAPAQEWSKRTKRNPLDVSEANACRSQRCALLDGRLAVRISAETSSYGRRYLPAVHVIMYPQPITSTVSRKAKSCFPLRSAALRRAFVSSSKPATGMFKGPSSLNRASSREHRCIAISPGLSYTRIGSSPVRIPPRVTS